MRENLNWNIPNLFNLPNLPKFSITKDKHNKRRPEEGRLAYINQYLQTTRRLQMRDNEGSMMLGHIFYNIFFHKIYNDILLFQFPYYHKAGILRKCS